MQRFITGLIVFIICGGGVVAGFISEGQKHPGFATAQHSGSLQFPALTGRVVDDAEILSAFTKQDLEQKLEAYESQSTNQVVVVTLPSLQGTSIEDFGYQLGRKWGIGQKGKDNGVLLIIAPVERKVRIEVGYGLEGTLTDAISSEIIQGIILPDFRAGHMEKGVSDGTNAIVDALGGIRPTVHSDTYERFNPATFKGLEACFGILMLFLMFVGKLVVLCDSRFYKEHPTLAMFLLIGRPGRHGSGGSGFGGGFFSGGGGSFGGGGASGGW